ncbi:MAG: hypothetical protein HY236_05605 [Acidobacteria bacterium]|nr:hypothetical protein [Acidobacteriota bacterium]
MTIRLQPGKTEYTEEEAARVLGVSAAQLRALLRNHVVEEEEWLSNVPLMRFRPSDLLLLSMLDHPGASGETVPSERDGGSPRKE